MGFGRPLPLIEPGKGTLPLVQGGIMSEIGKIPSAIKQQYTVSEVVIL